MRSIISYIFLFTAACLYGQEYYDDAQVRTHLAVEKKISKRFSARLSHQGRLTMNASTFSRSAIDLAVTYRITKNIRITADYAFIQRLNKYDYFDNRNWYSLAATFRKSHKRWTFLYRNLFQVRFRNMNSDNTHLARYYDRNKITVKYEATKRYTFYAGGEVYIPLNNPVWKGMDRYRGFTGVEIQTTKNQQLELYFMYQVRLVDSPWFSQRNQYDNSLLRRDFIYGIAYSFAL
jgi:hypothetical protein